VWGGLLLRFLVPVATLLLHLVTLSRYGYFRDELYFIACARHLAWGYVDQPPLVALLAWLASPFGYALFALRIGPAIAAALAVLVAMHIARDLGGGRFAQAFAGIAVALLPAYALVGNVLTTTSFEALSWTLVVWLTIRIVRTHGTPLSSPRNAWWYIGLAVAFGLYAKYSMGLLVAALLFGLICTPQRSVLRSWGVLIASGITVVLVLPNLLWQGFHGWPFPQVIAGDAAARHAFNTGLVLETQNMVTNGVAFLAEQFVYTNPLAAPLWLSGLAAPFLWQRLRDLRLLSFAYAALFVAAILLEARGYYVVGIYAPLLAVGAVVLERAAQWLRVSALVACTAVGVLTLPLALPVLSLSAFITYTVFLKLAPQDAEPPRVMQPIYAEELGWQRLAHDVAAYYNALPADVRAKTAIYADTYGDAGAIDFFGLDGIPKVISSENTYYLWGIRGYDGASLLAVGASRIGILQRYYRSCVLLGTSNEPLKSMVEGPAPIYHCTGPTMPLNEIWPHLRWYGA
jgi:hypothetical protein